MIRTEMSKDSNDLNLIREYVKSRILQTDTRGYVKSRESAKLDFKQAFNWANAAEYTKTMVAFANNQGGYLLFGVRDSPREIIGLSGDAFDNLTAEKVSEFMRSYFSTTVDYEYETLEIDGKKLGWIYTMASIVKPIICVKNSGKELKDGVIYYRNGARSEAINSTQLQQILDEQRQKDQDRWMNLFKNASRVGIENAAVLSLENGVVAAPGGTIVLDENILNDIKFIKEGEFNEKSGAPTLKIIGNVSTDGAAKIIEKVVDPDIKYPLAIKEVGLQLGFSPEGSAGPNALALVINYGLQSSEYMHEFNMGKAVYKKYSQEVVTILKAKADNNEFEIDKDSDSMKRIRKNAQRIK